jgi:hypothetical protein
VNVVKRFSVSLISIRDMICPVVSDGEASKYEEQISGG